MTQLQIVKSLARLQCTECGAEANASCNCGKPYLPKEIAKEAIRANPQKSNRAIAEETGVSEPTVRRARASGDAPETVVGLDGKTYKAKGKAPTPKAITAAPTPEAITAPEPKAIAAAPIITKSDDNGVSDFENLKKQVAELAQRFERLSPSQARQIVDLVEAMYDGVRGIVDSDDIRKARTKEAKNPQKVLDDARKLEQHYEMDGERDEAKREARQSGEPWSDVKDDWLTEWLRDNWGDQREQEFLDEFKDGWKQRHGQEYPGSDFAPTMGAGNDRAHLRTPRSSF